MTGVYCTCDPSSERLSNGFAVNSSFANGDDGIEIAASSFGIDIYNLTGRQIGKAINRPACYVQTAFDNLNRTRFLG